MNVKDFGLLWTYDLESTREAEATPLVVDRIVYVTASWNVVHAIDVRTGQGLWTYDPHPQVPQNALGAVIMTAVCFPVYYALVEFRSRKSG